MRSLLSLLAALALAGAVLSAPAPRPRPGPSPVVIGHWRVTEPDGRRTLLVMHADGRAEYYRDGHYQSGTWEADKRTGDCCFSLTEADGEGCWQYFRLRLPGPLAERLPR